jgi:rubrerythrin
MNSEKILSKPEIDLEIFKYLSDGRDESLAMMIWQQHCYHEKRRWSVIELVNQIDVSSLEEHEKAFIQNAGNAELTTKPGADRLSNLAEKECRLWADSNKPLSLVMQAIGTWSRYWNEEESHHETAFSYLTMASGLKPANNDMIVEHRKVFPDDNMLRTLVLLVFSEVTAAVQYADVAKRVKDPSLKKLLKQISADEIQHMRYFTTFAKALIDSGEYHPKDAFSIAHLYLRENGELYGSVRTHTESRSSHVNWWDSVSNENDAINLNIGIEKKQKMIFTALEKITNISVNTPEQVEDTWMELVAC